MVRKLSFKERFLGHTLSEPAAADPSTQTVAHRVPTGISGTASYGGYPTEEYLQKLRGRKRADVFDQMRRSDGQVTMVLTAVKNPIKQAQWEIAPCEENVTGKETHSDFATKVILKDKDFSFGQFIEEALTVCEFGHSVFEVTHKVVLDDPLFGSYNGIAELGWRSPRTLERWNLNPTGTLKSVSQYSYGDLNKVVDIPAEFLLVLSLGREGSNFEGVSLLRAIYGNWFRKNIYLKLNAIGIEKFAVPTPIATIPGGQQGGEQYDALIEALESYTQHETNYLTIPEGWTVDLKTNTYDPEKVEVSIDNEDKRMAKAFMANFLELGMGTTGSYSLSNDLSDFFLSGLEHIALKICDVVNNKLIPELVQMKYGPQAAYPKMAASGIADKVGEEFAKILKLLGDGQWLTPADDDENFVRRRYKLPLKSNVGVRTVKPASGFGNALSENRPLVDRIKLAHQRNRNGVEG